MNNYQFYELIIDNSWVYVLFLAFFSIVYYFILRRIVISILDPILFPIIFSVFGSATVYLLSYTGAINFYVLMSYTFTQIAFFLGLFSFKSIKGRVIFKWKQLRDLSEEVSIQSNNRLSSLIFYFSTIIYLSCQGLIYYLRGIPLFMDSRLETFVGGAGFGIIGRILDVTIVCSLYSFFTIVKFDRPRLSELVKYFLVGLIAISLILSGSKSSLIVIVGVLWAYLLFSVLKEKESSKLYDIYLVIGNNLKKMIALGLIVILIIIHIQTSSSDADLKNPIFMLALRFIHSGDIYWYAYPNEVYKIIDGSRGFSALFMDAMGFFRLEDWGNLPESIGVTLKNIHHPSKIIQGPNARHNVFGLIYYGFFGSIIFSFFMGWLISFVRNKLPYIIRGNIFWGIFFAYLAIKIPVCEIDPMLAFTYLNNAIFILPFVMIVISVMILPFLEKKPA